MARLYALQLADQRAMERQGIRENPIRRSGYAIQGGAHPSMGPTEPLEFALASHRAMEEHHNRTNPRRKGATPTMGLSQVRGGGELTITHSGGGLFGNYHKDTPEEKAHKDQLAAMTPEQRAKYKADMKKLRGGRAVPSSGLSQFRGGSGSNGVVVGGGMGSDSEESDDEYEGGARDMEIMARESGRRPAIRSGQSDQHSVEAKEMGRHLGRHLMTARGGGFFELFTKGIVEAGREGADVAKFTGLPNSSPPPIPDPNASAGPDATPDAGPDAGATPPPPSGGSALFYRQGDMSKDVEEHHEEHTARRFGRTHRGGAGIFSGIMPKKEEGPRSMVYTPEDAQRDRQSEKQRQEDRKRRGDMYVASPTNNAPSGFVGTLKRVLVQDAKKPKVSMKGGVNPRTEGLTDEQIRAADYLKDIPTLRKGGMLSGAYEGMGELKITHSGGARAARAAIVKKVMAEQGCSMPQASKYVKEHGLYKGGAAVGEDEDTAEFQRKNAESQRAKMAKMPLLEVAKGKGRRAPAGPHDGRRKRAEIVKKVMGEKGCSMIEASKYVKAHNLY